MYVESIDTVRAECKPWFKSDSGDNYVTLIETLYGHGMQ